MISAETRQIINLSLEATRKSLLDLSGRNRLLNFKQSGATTLRIVDEAPNQIYLQLIESADDPKKGFTVSPVPMPKKADYPIIESSKDLEKIDVKSHALFLGIKTDYELVSSSSTNERHTDDLLQTLHYPEDLDRKLRRIHSEARTAIEESGVNMLFLCLGYLKWSDHKDSQVFHSAPLIMVPIELARQSVDRKTGFAKFKMHYTGEDILDNICLREKLGQFGLELPSFEDYTSPEEYFSAIKETLTGSKPDWSIEKFATVGFLSFGKMLMYLDLDPSKWPGQEGIADATHIVDILTGNHSGGSSTSSEYDIDQDNSLPKVSLITDADSSQHSAIVDVLVGRNLVVEGPPGTGKSQTITNMIAACLEQGKTVLFVAEKLAALEVVRKRLDAKGLGDFCLELHSHKTQKKAFLADLKKRLNMGGTMSRYSSADIDNRIRELNSKKSKLIEYATVVNAPFGKTEETPHQIFWKTEVLFKSLKESYCPEDFPSFDNADQTGEPEIRANADQIQNLADNLRDYYKSDLPTPKHFWSGLEFGGAIDFATQEDCFRALQSLAASLKAAKTAHEVLSAIDLAYVGFDAIARLSDDVSIFGQEDFAHARLLQRLNTSDLGNLASSLQNLRSLKQTCDQYEAELAASGVSDTQINSFQGQTLQGLGSRALTPLGDTASLFNQLTDLLSSLKASETLIKEASNHLSLEMADQLVIVKSIGAVCDFASKLDLKLLSARSSEIENAIGNPDLDTLLAEVESLRQVRNELDAIYDLEKVPSIAALSDIHERLKNTKMLRVVSSGWRAAKNSYKAFARQKDGKDQQAILNSLSKLLEHQKAVEAFQKNPAYISLLPSLFKGLETATISLNNGISFYGQLKQNFLSVPAVGTKLYNCVKNMDRHVIEWFHINSDALAQLHNNLTTVRDMLTSLSVAVDATTLEAVFQSAEKANAELRYIQDAYSKASLPDCLVPSKINSFIEASQKIEGLLNTLGTDPVLRSLGLEVQSKQLGSHIDVLTSISSLHAKLTDMLPPSAVAKFYFEDGYTRLSEACRSAGDIKKYLADMDGVKSYLSAKNGLADFFGSDTANDISLLNSANDKLDNLNSQRESYDKWCEVINNYHQIRSSGLSDIIKNFAQTQNLAVPFSQYVQLYKYIFYHSLSNIILRRHSVLGTFSRINHENIRTSFKEIDLELQKLNSRSLAREISRRNIPIGNGGRTPKEFTQKHLIEHEIGKQKAHIPIRQLVNRAYEALVAMKPCFMMGPLSVAQYIPPGREKFDVLIMDEASQVKPEDAIGVLARAKQVVIVGDSNQLPPTGFFDTIGDGEVNDEESTIQNSESILDVCKPIFQPLRRLRWHYRSQHQSLISFSNHHFYENDLIIFPSPTANSDMVGVKHVYVEDGVYSSQSNLNEARRIVSELAGAIQARPDFSYGLVSLNAKQKMLIEDEVDRVRRDNPQLDQYISTSENGDEPFFVKNLENVQGDERDVIFISTTFGLDEAGVFRQNFGPINGKDGWRRLNVLFTRAKRHVRVFSSFLPERIKIDETREQRGLRALKDYLNFAITGMDNHSYLTGEEPDSDFEVAVGSFLKYHGYDVVYQLGVAGYKIDLVVRDPECPTEYFIAVECDGATYHSAKSARDRDRLREENLRKLGWSHIHRIWSTDWFRRREQEEKRLLDAVERALEGKKRAA